MLRVAVRCEGISPYLMNPATDALLDQLRTGKAKVKAKDLSVEEEAAAKLQCDERGRPGVPSLNLFSSMIIAGRKVQYKSKTNISTATSTLLTGMLSIDPLFLPFNGDPKWVVDKRRGVATNTTGGAAVCLIRPKFLEWGFDATLDVDETEIAPETIREVLRISGKFVGLGDFRPAKKGPFGKFKITRWEELGEVAEV